MAENIEKFIKENNFKFNTPNLLTEAFTHRSYLNEVKSSNLNHNERMEFLGDAVLELVVTEFLFAKYKTYSEGFLTSIRSALVKTESLALEAQKLKLGDYILMSKGEESSGGRARQYILANTFESVIGALYLDTSNGYESAKKFILTNLCYKTEKIISERQDIDPKSKLQELAQEVHKLTPRYTEVSSVGPDHNKIFEMAVLLGEKEYGRGKGKSKQEAEQEAALMALKDWKNP